MQRTDADDVDREPRRYVSAEGLTHQVPDDNGWAGIGREIGIATREGLNAVVDSANKFGSTRVGTFIMLIMPGPRRNTLRILQCAVLREIPKR